VQATENVDKMADQSFKLLTRNRTSVIAVLFYWHDCLFSGNSLLNFDRVKTDKDFIQRIFWFAGVNFTSFVCNFIVGGTG